MTVTCKVGFDGTTGQTIYKQVLLEPDINRDLKCEGSLFITCVVLLDLTGFHNNNEKVSIFFLKGVYFIIWNSEVNIHSLLQIP